jgi:hypothetical protein
MIQTSGDFNSAIELLTTDVPVSVGDIDEKMNSAEFNLAFNDIEMQLIDLYEKVRVLEDVQKYCREYVIKEVSEKRQKFEDKLKIIEDNADSYRDKTFVACAVPFYNSNETVRDRDGSVLPASTITNRSAHMSGQVVEEAIFRTVSKVQDTPHYRDSLSNIVSGESYRSLYVVDNPVSGGVEEEITIMFDSTRRCNYFDIDLSNCVVVSAKYINESDGEEPIEDAESIYGLLKNAKGIKIRVRSTNYQNAAIPVGRGAMNTDFWNRICSAVYMRTPGMSGLYDAMQGAGEAAFTFRCGDYKQQLAVWQRDKLAIAERNLAIAHKNGGE